MKNILIVDDEFLIRYSLSQTLIGDDREVITASNGREALLEVQGRCIDLCLLDLHLPDMNGLDIMRKLRDISPATKIIIITGSVITDAMMKSIQENAHLLLTKPFDIDEVKAFVDRLLVHTGPGCAVETTALLDNEPFIQRFIRQVITENRDCGRKITVIPFAGLAR
jgi:DNA-binding response OmpR family regulator